MTSSTTTRRSAANHKATTNQKAGTVQKASEQHEATIGQDESGKAVIEQARSGRSVAMGIKLPVGTRDNLLWWGGLAALAAFEIVEWPVAAVVAVGAWIAEQHGKQQQLAGAEDAS